MWAIFNIIANMSTSSKKLILVIGATGAQGIAVVEALIAPSADGSPSPYAVRALTRDPEHRRSRDLAAKGVELFKGMLDNCINMLMGILTGDQDHSTI